MHKLMIRPRGPDGLGYHAETRDGGQSWRIPDEEEARLASGVPASELIGHLEHVAKQKAMASLINYQPTTPEIVGVLEAFPGSEILEAPDLPDADVDY